MDREWWKDKLAGDIYETFRIKEQQLLSYSGHSPQIWVRRHLVDWLSVLVECFDLATTTQHLAVYLLDHFMDKLEVDQHHLYLLALSCLIIAVKFEEHIDKTPGLVTLNSLIPKNSSLGVSSGYNPSELLSMEITVLNYFEWMLSLPTVAQFLPYYLLVSVDETDMLNGLPITKKSTIQAYVEKHARYFQEISLQDQVFRSYPPSHVAAACIAASRIVLQLTPTWPNQMELMTDYYLEELLPCVQMLLSFQEYEQQNPKSHPVPVMPERVQSSFSAVPVPGPNVYHINTTSYPTVNVPYNYQSASMYCTYDLPSTLPLLGSFAEPYIPGVYPESRSQILVYRGP